MAAIGCSIVRGEKKHTKFHIHLATSTDLFNWKRHAANPMVVDGYDARDPMVMKSNDQWILYYAATSRPEGGNYTVKAVTSRDLSHWVNQQEVFRDPRNWYVRRAHGIPLRGRTQREILSFCLHQSWIQRDGSVCEPYSAALGCRESGGKISCPCCRSDSAPEGQWFVSRAGWGQGGVYLAELTWQS